MQTDREGSGMEHRGTPWLRVARSVRYVYYNRTISEREKRNAPRRIIRNYNAMSDMESIVRRNISRVRLRVKIR